MMRRPIDHAKREQEHRDHQDCGTLIMREKRQREETFLPPVPLESSVVLARDYLLTYCSPIMGVMIHHSMLDWTIQRQLRLSTRGGWLIGLILWISAGTPLNNPRTANSEHWTRSPPPDKGCGSLSLSLRERRGAVEDETSRCAIRTAKEPFANSIQTAATAEHGTSVFFFEESLFVAKLAIIHRKM